MRTHSERQAPVPGDLCKFGDQQSTHGARALVISYLWVLMGLQQLYRRSRGVFLAARCLRDRLIKPDLVQPVSADQKKSMFLMEEAPQVIIC